jgi:hypothetical protein
MEILQTVGRAVFPTNNTIFDSFQPDRLSGLLFISDSMLVSTLGTNQLPLARVCAIGIPVGQLVPILNEINGGLLCTALYVKER